jgi:hypothetical protein
MTFIVSRLQRRDALLTKQLDSLPNLGLIHRSLCNDRSLALIIRTTSEQLLYTPKNGYKHSYIALSFLYPTETKPPAGMCSITIRLLSHTLKL